MAVLSTIILAALAAFHPGEEWRDTSGNPIQAHGGSVIAAEGRFWWYGENKEKTDGVSDVWHWGMRIYSSTDLYNWKDEGLFIPPVLNDPKSTLRPAAYADRPHVLYCEKTKKYVCWIKIMENEVQTMTILVADRIVGPYRLVRERFRPDGMCAGDFDLVKDGDDAYIVFEEPHVNLVVSKLSDDYTDTVGQFRRSLPHGRAPFTREAPAHFVRAGKHYLFTSGTSGYWPNPTEVDVADSMLGDWKRLCAAAPTDATDTTFGSQISSVFKVPGKKDLYIALGDRWLPDNTNSWSVVSNAFEVATRPPEGRGTDYPKEEAKAREFWKRAPAKTPATMKSRYVWLPVAFDTEGRPQLKWRDSWRLEDYPDEALPAGVEVTTNWCARLLDRNGNATDVTNEVLKVTWQIRKDADGATRYRPTVSGVPEGMTLEWFDGPRVIISNDHSLYWPFYDGCVVTNFANREGSRWEDYRPLGYTPRRKAWGALYPTSAQMQFLAAYKNGRGVYFAAEDARHTPKGVEYDYLDEKTTRLSLQTFCGDMKDGVWSPAFDYVVRPYACDAASEDDGWMTACGFYRDWVRTLPAFAKKPVRPDWLKANPVNLIYAVQGEGIDHGPSPMKTNCYYPYLNILPVVEKYAKAFDSKIMALLMHWEGTAPWCPPYVWPPLGGEKELAKLRDALHARGDLLGVYCSGTAWTQTSSINPSYSMEKKCRDEGLERYMMRGPKGQLEACICNDPAAQRLGYDLCLTEDWSIKTLADELRKISAFGIDYCQFFDQNIGGGALLCYSKEHKHPSVPGAWQTDAMLALQSKLLEVVRANSPLKESMLLGCEGSAATPYVPNLPYNDSREGAIERFGRHVPGMSYVFHEWMCNFSGNQIGQTTDAIDRLTRAFHCGDTLSVVLGPDGKLANAWGIPWDQPLPDQEKLIAAVRNFNDLRKRYPEFLMEGERIKPFAPVPAGARSSFWRAADGRRIGFISEAPGEVSVLRDPCRLTIGVLSDIHIPEMNHTQHFRKALKWYDEQKVDGVIIAGDLGFNGLIKEMKVVADVWDEIFPNDTRSDGGHVEKLFITGNHDVDGYFYHQPEFPKVKFPADPEKMKEAFVFNREKVWKELFHEAYEPVKVKEIKGYKFVLRQWYAHLASDVCAERWLSPPPDEPLYNSLRYECRALETFFKEHGAELKGEKPWFYVQHNHPADTLYSPWCFASPQGWGDHDCGESTQFLKDYPNCVALSGHTHTSLNFEQSFWQGAFTSIETSACPGLAMAGAAGGGRANCSWGEKDFKGTAFDCETPKVGQLMRVFDDRIVLENREFTTGEPLSEPRVIPWPISRGKPFAYDARKTDAVAPEFPADAKIVRTDDGNEISITFPTVRAENAGRRAIDYEVTCEGRARSAYFWKIVDQRRVYSEGMALPEKHDCKPVTVVYSREKLEKSGCFEFRFSVRPADSWNKLGKPLKDF